VSTLCDGGSGRTSRVSKVVSGVGVTVAAILIASATTAETELPFDHDRFCDAAKDTERRSNEDRGKWIEEDTRYDGITVSCENRTVEFKLFVQLGFIDIPGNWKDRTNYKWSADYCTDPSWAAAINNRWKVALVVRSAIGEDAYFRADCH